MLLGDHHAVPHVTRGQLCRQHGGFPSACSVLRMVQQLQSQLIRLVHLVLGPSDHEIRGLTAVLGLVEPQVCPRLTLQSVDGLPALAHHVPDVFHRNSNLDLDHTVSTACVARSVVGGCCSAAPVHAPGIGASSSFLNRSLLAQRVLKLHHTLLNERLGLRNCLVGTTHDQIPHARIGFVQLHATAAVFPDAIDVLASCTDHATNHVWINPNGIAVAIIQPAGRAASSGPRRGPRVTARSRSFSGPHRDCIDASRARGPTGRRRPPSGR
mmetsp:Transcript_66289/g.176849  ORF Transcript_66289/g.176849 Transcript_66289/m.176849 type:complete len:269 (-) Transcript_66289:110-916(-)